MNELKIRTKRSPVLRCRTCDITFPPFSLYKLNDCLTKKHTVIYMRVRVTNVERI